MTWETQQRSFYDPETEAKLKQAFAQALLRNPHNPYAAAREIEPTQSEGRAQWMVNAWQNDPDVIAAMGDRVAEVGPARAGLPTKEELAAQIYREAAGIKDSTTKLSYYRAVADVMGYIQKSNINVNSNNVVNAPKVQLVPVFNTDSDFEGYAKRVQERLASM